MRKPKKLNPKVKAAAGVGTGGVAAIWLAGLFGLEMPPEVAASLVSIVMSAAGWLKSAPPFGPPK